MQWSLDWKLLLNPENWYICISVIDIQVFNMSDNNQICTVEKYVDLGITIDSSLSFPDHIINIVCKAQGACCQIFSAFQSRNLEFVAAVFTMYVRPILEYGCQIWNPHLKNDA